MPLAEIQPTDPHPMTADIALDRVGDDGLSPERLAVLMREATSAVESLLDGEVLGRRRWRETVLITGPTTIVSRFPVEAVVSPSRMSIRDAGEGVLYVADAEPSHSLASTWLRSSVAPSRSPNEEVVYWAGWIMPHQVLGPWAPSAQIEPGQWFDVGGLFVECLEGGETGELEPDWPSDVYQEVSEGGIRYRSAAPRVLPDILARAWLRTIEFWHARGAFITSAAEAEGGGVVPLQTPAEMGVPQDALEMIRGVSR